MSKGQETLWAAKPESRFEDGCEIELPYMHLEIFGGKLYLKYIHFSFDVWGFESVDMSWKDVPFGSP